MERFCSLSEGLCGPAPSRLMPRVALLTHQPPVAAPADTKMLSEPAGTMALIRETGRERDLRECQIRGHQQILRPSYAALHQVVVRCHARRCLNARASDTSTARRWQPTPGC